MELFAELWLAMLLSAVFVFVVSSIMHMLLPFHWKDYVKLPGEEQIMTAIRGQNVEPGDYMFPCPGSAKEMSSPEIVEKYKQGPVGLLTVRPNGTPNMGKCLGQWIVYLLVVSAFVAYVCAATLPRGAEYLKVFQVVGTIAIMVYAFGAIPNSIWKGTPWSTTVKFLIDGVIYGLVTAGVFGWLWPAAV